MPALATGKQKVPTTTMIDNSLFSDSISTSNLSWTWDNPSGNLDSTAFGDYREKSGFFVIDRGYNIDASLRGFKKISIDSGTTGSNI